MFRVERGLHPEPEAGVGLRGSCNKDGGMRMSNTQRLLGTVMGDTNY